MELRACDSDDLEPGVVKKTERFLWLRPKGPIPDDPLLHAATLTYASDRTLISTAARRHGLVPGQMRGASLDHAMWSRDGRRIASVCQEGLLRVPRKV